MKSLLAHTIAQQLSKLYARYPTSKHQGSTHIQGLASQGLISDSGSADGAQQAITAYIAFQLLDAGYFAEDTKVRECLANKELINTVYDCLENVRREGRCKVDFIRKKISPFANTHDPCDALISYICPLPS